MHDCFTNLPLQIFHLEKTHLSAGRQRNTHIFLRWRQSSVTTTADINMAAGIAVPINKMTIEITLKKKKS